LKQDGEKHKTRGGLNSGKTQQQPLPRIAKDFSTLPAALNVAMMFNEFQQIPKVLKIKKKFFLQKFVGRSRVAAEKKKSCLELECQINFNLFHQKCS
jgi:hypothetical protein